MPTTINAHGTIPKPVVSVKRLRALWGFMCIVIRPSARVAGNQIIRLLTYETKSIMLAPRFLVQSVK